MSRMTTVLKLAMPAFLLLTVQFALAAESGRRQPAPADAPESLLRKYLEALDRMDMDGTEAIAKQAAGQSHGPVTELMIRHTRLLTADKSDPLPKQRTRQESGGDRKRALFTRTYSVADLVLPVLTPEVISSPPSTEAKSNQPTPKPDFDSLIDLIETTVKPATWDAVGGPGSIAPFTKSFSIVVTQTQEVHDEIVGLLEQLRRLQDMTLMLEARMVVMLEDEMPGSIHETDNQHGATLDLQQVKRLVETAGKNGNTTALRRVTMMNGQTTGLPVFDERGDTRFIVVQAVASNDRRHVRLALCPDKAQLVCASIGDGKTLVVDLTPMPAGWPAEEKRAVTHRLLLITPRIIIAEEEEEKLGILPAAKN
jgi:hypothetical protein